MTKIGLLNGPNLDRTRGKREPEMYGSVNLAQIQQTLENKAHLLNFQVDYLLINRIMRVL